MRLFITGTDTDVGKTYISCSLLKNFNEAGLSTIALKPLASGCEQGQNGFVNQDALLLQQHASIALPYEQVNPFTFEPPIAPHIAAAKIQSQLNVQSLYDAIHPPLAIPADIHLIEGVGGWLMPLNDKETMADFAVKLQADIILVVGMRLGCLNHALLTYESIKQQKGNLVGWVANCIDPAMECLDENIGFLTGAIAAPLLSVVSYRGKAMFFL